MIKSKSKVCLVFVILMLVAGISKVHGLPTVKIYPSEGTIYTDIFIQVRYDGHDGKLYLFWDNSTVLIGASQNLNDQNLALGFDITFNPPNLYPYSELGTRNIHRNLLQSAR